MYSTLSHKEITRFSLGIAENELLPIAKLNKELVNAMHNLNGSGTQYETVQGNLKLGNDIPANLYLERQPG